MQTRQNRCLHADWTGSESRWSHTWQVTARMKSAGTSVGISLVLRWSVWHCVIFFTHCPLWTDSFNNSFPPDTVVFSVVCLHTLLAPENSEESLLILFGSLCALLSDLARFLPIRLKELFLGKQRSQLEVWGFQSRIWVLVKEQKPPPLIAAVQHLWQNKDGCTVSMSVVTSTLKTFKITSGQVRNLQPILRKAHRLDSSKSPWISCDGPLAFRIERPQRRHRHLQKTQVN